MAWLAQVRQRPVALAVRVLRPLVVQVALVPWAHPAPAQAVLALLVQPVAMVAAVAPLRIPVAREATVLLQTAEIQPTPAPRALPRQVTVVRVVLAVPPMAVLEAKAVLLRAAAASVVSAQVVQAAMAAL